MMDREIVQEMSQKLPAPDAPASERARPGFRELADVLDRHGDEIAMLWSQYSRAAFPFPEKSAVPDEENEAMSRRLVRAIADALASPSFEPLERVLSGMFVDYRGLSYGLDQLLTSLSFASEALLEFMQRAYPAHPERTLACMAQMDRCLYHNISFYARMYAREMNRQRDRHQAQIAIMLSVLQSVGSTLDLCKVLTAVAEGIAASLGTPVYLVVMGDAERREVIREPVCARLPETAPSSEFLERLAALCSGYLEALPAEIEPAPRYGKDFPAALLVPLTSHDRLLAIVALARDSERGHARFTEEEIDLARSLARLATQALRNAHLHQQVKQQAIIQERERLAGELHDGLSQALGTLNWRASTMDRLLSQGDIEQARALLQEMKAIAKQGYADARESLLMLRSASALESGFLPALEHWLAEYQALHGLSVELLIDSSEFPQLPTEVRLQLIRIIQEALTNVHKHAGAGRVRLAFSQDRDGIALRIEDDGRGFDPAGVEREGGRHFGLAIMRERASHVGGRLTIDSAPGAGTRLVLRLPAQNGE